MSEFLALSACKGRRPERILGQRFVSRPDLVARLLRERHVARFIVAPSGFGKSTLAFEYADTVLSFNHVFWINAKSPCFLRDLDAGVIVSRLRALDEDSFLAVFEDVPFLDAARVSLFSAVIDGLLDCGCEVLVTCTPACDAYAQHHRDRMKLSSSDLLLTDFELASPLSAGLRRLSADTPACRRVAALCWGDDDGAALVSDVAREELPDEIRLALFVMLALRQGSWSDIEAFMTGGKVRDVARYLGERYPITGIDMRAERYETIDVPPPAIASAFEKVLDGIARQSLFENRGAFVAGVSDALLARGEGERACSFMASAASREASAEWLSKRGLDLAKIACFQPAHALFWQVRKKKGSYRAFLDAHEAIRLVALGDEDAATDLASRAGFSSKDVPEARVWALLVLVLHAEGEERSKALKALQLVLVSEGVMGANFDVHAGSAVGFGALSVRAMCEKGVWAMVGCMLLALEGDCASALRLWRSVARVGGPHSFADADPSPSAATCSAASSRVSSDGLRVVTAILLDELARRVFLPEGSEDARVAYGEIASYAADQLIDTPAGECDYVSAMLTRALLRACDQGVLPLKYTPPHHVVSFMRKLEADVAQQRSEYVAVLCRTSDRRAEYRATHPDAFRIVGSSGESARPSKVPPVLHVNLFGGLDVRIGSDAVDPRLLRRQKVKMLLAVLVLNKGREISYDKLSEILWPGKDHATSRKNYYAVWSQLRRALSTPDGACPYLVRDGGGCKLDARMVETDVSLFEETCRELLLGKPSFEDCERLLTVVNESFSDDLLPSEQGSDYIEHKRADFRMRLVDAMVAASSHLVGIGEAGMALWFAREALTRDATREDVYVALMEAQIAANQRAAALGTYFSLRRYLAEELGIDPSAKTVRLYREIIESDDVVDW